MNLQKKIWGAVAIGLLLPGCSAFTSKPVVVEPAECVCPDFTAPLAPTIVQVNEAKPCPVVKPVAPKVAPVPVLKPLNPPRTDLMMVGLVENVKVHTLNLELKAKFDTGALFTSINAQELKKFERDGKKWARFAVMDPDDNKKKIFYELPIVRTKVIKQLSGKYQERPVVILTLSVANIKEPVEVTLSDRTGYVYQLLIGRNFMENRMVVDMGKTFIAK
jgi:hypothetical protein